MLTRISMLVLVGAVQTGCGEISYKRGASPSELQAAQARCKSADARDAYVNCMDQQGWTVQKMEDLDPLSEQVPDPAASIAYSPDNRSPTVTEAVTVPQGQTPLAIKPEPSPSDVFKISSWWKMGGSPALLKQDLQACVTELGEMHRPPADQRQATRGLLVCMKKRGWYGLQEYKRQ